MARPHGTGCRRVLAAPAGVTGRVRPIVVAGRAPRGPARILVPPDRVLRPCARGDARRRSRPRDRAAELDTVRAHRWHPLARRGRGRSVAAQGRGRQRLRQPAHHRRDRAPPTVRRVEGARPSAEARRPAGRTTWRRSARRGRVPIDVAAAAAFVRRSMGRGLRRRPRPERPAQRRQHPALPAAAPRRRPRRQRHAGGCARRRPDRGTGVRCASDRGGREPPWRRRSTACPDVRCWRGAAARRARRRHRRRHDTDRSGRPFRADPLGPRAVREHHPPPPRPPHRTPPAASLR